ncbi:MAG: membrane protein insertase YidC, partial [Erythrobacter sp.]|nr:membrane protein insertase YidC [Erythrobacter sp.]
MDNQRNLLLAVVLSGLLILGWDVGMRYFYPEAAQTASVTDSGSPAQAGAAAGTVDIGADAKLAQKVTLQGALASPDRVMIDTPRVAGSINLVGARIDDIVLKDYRETLKKDSGPVRLFAPEGTPGQYFAEFGFVTGGLRQPSTALWQADGAKLTPETPVTLTRTDAAGVTYTIRFAIDADYMITADQTATNASAAAAIIQPFALIKRTSTNATPDQFVAHSGPVGVFGGTLWDPHSYNELAELGGEKPEGAASWLGFTDQYWLGALVPGRGETDSVGFRALGGELFRSDLLYAAKTVPAGGKL